MTNLCKQKEVKNTDYNAILKIMNAALIWITKSQTKIKGIKGTKKINKIGIHIILECFLNCCMKVGIEFFATFLQNC